MPNFTKEQVNKIIEEYKEGKKIKDIVNDNQLYNNSHLYYLLKRHKIPLRGKKGGKKEEEFKIFKIEEDKGGFISRIANANVNDIDKIYKEYKNN